MRRPPVRHCRNSLAWGAVLFLVVQVAFGVGLDLFAPLARFAFGSGVLREAEKRPRVVFFGSSRFGASLDATEINRLLRASFPSENVRVQNAAVPAGNAISTEFLLDLFLKQGTRPEYVVLEIAPENLNYPGTWLGVQVTRQLGWKHVPTHFVESVRTSDGMRYVGSLLLPTFQHRERVFEALAEWRQPPAGIKDNWDADAPIDWSSLLAPGAPSSGDDRARLYPGVLAARRWLRDYTIGGQTALALRRVLRRCHDESIRVIFLLPPLASGHRDEYLPPIEAAFQAHLNALREEFEFRVIDARDWLPDSLFSDASHPTLPEGQSRFSRMLTRRVLLDLVRPTSEARTR